MRVDVEQLYVTRYYVESMVLEDWKVELIVHTEGFSFFFFSRNRLNDFMKMYYSIFSLITLFLFTFPWEIIFVVAKFFVYNKDVTTNNFYNNIEVKLSKEG